MFTDIKKNLIILSMDSLIANNWDMTQRVKVMEFFKKNSYFQAQIISSGFMLFSNTLNIKILIIILLTLVEALVKKIVYYHI